MQAIVVSTTSRLLGTGVSQRDRFKNIRSPKTIPRASNNAPLELPGGGYWWVGARNKDAVIYGTSFVITRPPIGGDGLIPAPKKQEMQPYRSPNNTQQSLAVHEKQSLGLTLLGGMVVIDTEWEEITSLSPSTPPQENTTCTGIVYVGRSSDNNGISTQDVGAASGRHPRRTRRMRFTCNLCGTVNEKEVNPWAWKTGSVFARCDGCTAVHKLKDNLKIFHELKGPVFPPRDMRDSFPAVKEILDRIKAKNDSLYNNNNNNN